MPITAKVDITGWIGLEDTIYQEYSTGKIAYARSARLDELLIPLNKEEFVCLHSHSMASRYDSVYLLANGKLLSLEDLRERVSRFELIESFNEILKLDRDSVIHSSVSARARNIMCSIIDDDEYESYTGN